MDTEERSSAEQLRDALALEANRFSASIRKCEAEAREKNQAVVSNCAAMGVLGSSRRYIAEMQNWWDSVLEVVQQAITREESSVAGCQNS